MIKIPEIQYISRNDAKYEHAEQARLMFKNGIKWVQIRMKNASESEIIRQSKKAKEYAVQYGGKLIINDSVEIAKEVKAHGIHLGLNDIPIDKAREILGKETIIGGTANTIEDIQLQVSRGADYVGLGPFRFTNTKENLSPVIGLEGYRTIMKQLKELNITIPIVAVGGIQMVDIPEIIKTGINGVAISGALFEKVKE